MATMVATPTGALSMGGLDFLDRLAIAEQRDSHRAVANDTPLRSSKVNAPPGGTSSITLGSVPEVDNTPKPALTTAPNRRKKRSLSWHPRVVTRIEGTHDNSASRLRETNITEYNPEEEKAAIARMMVKAHLKEMTSRVDRNTRTRLNAVAADEAWKRADDLRMELERAGEAPTPINGGLAVPLEERQKQAARRCLEQPHIASLGSASEGPAVVTQQQPKPSGGASVQHHDQNTTVARGPSPRPASAGNAKRVVPGRPMARRGNSPRGGRQSNPQGRPSPGYNKQPPGGASSFVFG